jgi:uncharacterized protein (TIGR03437 family)
MCVTAACSMAAEADALAISTNIRARHMPFGTILDPTNASATSNQIVGYTRCGDSALWTGAYLAAEAFRYKVTQSAGALDNVKTALAGLKSLADVTGDNRLARCIVSAASPFAAGIASEEDHNTVHQAPPWIWVDNTSRDEVVGAFFGLGAAFDLVDDASVKSGIADLATRLIFFIADHQWSPNDDISNTFEVRPEELQMLLQVARHVNPSIQISGPIIVPPIITGVAVDVQSNNSYFKFNLDFMTFYNYARYDGSGNVMGAYQKVRDYTASHQNAFFNMVDRALNGPDDARDAETRNLLDLWLARPDRDFSVDLSNTVQVCGSTACQPIPLVERPPADFLWQVSPFQLSGGGRGVIEGAGIDYILPYWMARYYGVITPSQVSSAAAATGVVAPASLASLYGSNLAGSVAEASEQPLPTMLGGLSVSVTDATGNQADAGLVYVSPGQVNFAVPDRMSAGSASFAVTSNGTTQKFSGTISSVAPSLFTMTGTGIGVAAATAIAVSASNAQVPVSVFQCNSGCTPTPIGIPDDSSVFVTFYATGVRNRSSVAGVTATISGITVPVTYAGPAPGFTGLDQVNVQLTPALRGRGESKVVLVVDGQTSNAATISLQ